MSNSSTGDAGPVCAWNRQNLVVSMLPVPPGGVVESSHELLELDHATGSPMTCHRQPRQRSANGNPEGRNRASATSSSKCQADATEPGSSFLVAVVHVLWTGCAVIVRAVLILSRPSCRVFHRTQVRLLGTCPQRSGAGRW